MKYTTLTVQVNTIPNPVATGVFAQIDQQSLDMMQFDKGASPFDLFNIYIPYDPVGIKRNNHLIDENDGTHYTVSARPESFLDGHTECQGMVKVGS